MEISSAVTDFFFNWSLYEATEAKVLYLVYQAPSTVHSIRKHSANICWTNEWMSNFKPSMKIAQSLHTNVHYKNMAVHIQFYKSDQNKAMQAFRNNHNIFRYSISTFLKNAVKFLLKIFFLTEKNCKAYLI